MNRVRACLALIVACGFGLLSPATCDAELRVESQQLDLGKVMAGSAAVGTFVFHNDGDRDINILHAKPS